MDYKKSNYHIIRKIKRYFRILYERALININNHNIRSKTIYLYVFCVLVPVILTNLFVIGNAMKASYDESIENINNIADSVSQDISSFIENAVYLTVDIYASSSMYKFLDTRYLSNGKFLQEYNKVFDNYIFYASSKYLISDITLYSDNPTMLNGGRYYRMDTIRSKEWYQEFIRSKEDLFIYPYFNKSIDINQKNRMISIIRKLNYVEMSKNEKIVKLDLNYNKMAEAIKNSAFNTTVYVCHGDKIIFSNDITDKNLKVDFNNISGIPKKDIQIHKSSTAYGFDFDVYLRGYKSNYRSMLKENLGLIAVLFLADALIPAIMLSLFSNSISKRILLLGKYMKKMKGEEFELIPKCEGRDEIRELLDNYNLMAVRMKTLIEYEYKSRLEQQELYLARQQAELLALYSQINPHFMFNVLESIRMRSLIKGEEETSRMIESLAKLMRKSAEWGSDLITIEQEIDFVRDYLELQKYRYGDGFNYKIRISEECRFYKIPSLILVTFAENSCVHGLNREGHSGTIFLSINVEDDFLRIEIEDTGVGMEEDQVIKLEKILNEASIDDLQKASSLGMLNACIRLKKYCGNLTKIFIESEREAGTCITIQIPLENLSGLSRIDLC
ncbi:sensor histidine kinase [Anaerocolumna sp. MB42-C2]|uniref:sensor histidine kinase n=1 Tax=Anaerocolumna sp. MB42-C2 TaxID=3070997 RepID=UPI0027DF2F79|nr:histidine kinase [Anaerocolumna sp. MB42-C2]WMJ86598.1 histidine kinase [Anaerocolumna sp. MB42-C2]